MAFFRWVLPLIVLQGHLIAAFERPLRSASSESPGISAIASPWPGQWLVNPASLALATAPCIVGTIVPAPFGMTEINGAGIGCSTATGYGGIGFSASVFGTSVYKESTGKLSFGCAPVGGVEIGLSIAYYSVSIDRYGSGDAAGLDVGAIITPIKFLRLGFIATNINSPSIGMSRDPLPRQIGAGATLDMFDRFGLSIETVKDAGFPVASEYGIEYRPHEALSISFGAAAKPATAGGGLVVSYGQFRIEYTFRYHQQLGISHFVSLHFSFNGEYH